MCDQEDTLAAYVTSRGWQHLGHVTDPGVSGRKMANRPGLTGALDRLDRGEADVLIAAKVDRLARSTVDFAKMLDRAERHGWSVVVLDVQVDSTSAAGRLVVEVVSAAAAFESRRIGERVKSSHAVRRAQGIRSSRPLLPEELRQRIYSDHLAGVGLHELARRLNAENVPTATPGAMWYASTIQAVIRSVQLDHELAATRAENDGG